MPIGSVWMAATAVLTAITVVLSSPLASSAQPRGQGVAGELLVGFRHGVSPAKAQGTYSVLGGAKVEEITQINVHRIRVPEASLDKIKDALSHRPEVLFVEENGILPLQQMTNDPQLGSEWHVFKINAPGAWDYTPAESGVVIAILDSGVEPTHPDLVSRLVPGYSPYDNTTNTADVYGHGTKVAGTAAAAGNNATGVAGVAWNARIMPVRVSDNTGYAYYSTVASGITWAVDHGAKVMNISIGGVAGSSSILSAAQYAQTKGAVVVAAAGNCGCFDSTSPNAYLISVSATGSSDEIMSWSSTGNYVDVAAPGSGILTTSMGGGYSSVSGTSFASPITAGVVALMLSANPSLKPSDLEKLLKSTAVDFGAAGWDTSYGYGRVDALAAVTAALSTAPAADTTAPSVSMTNPKNGSTVAGGLSVSASVSDNVGVTRTELWVDGALVASGTTGQFYLDTTKYANGGHAVAVRALDAAGNAGSASASVTFNNTTTVDTVPPTVGITSIWSTNGGTNVSVSASDDVKVAKVELYVDGKLAGSSTSSSPTFKLNKKALPPGTHNIQAKAYDSSNNAASSAALTYVAQ